ncbi:MAG: PIN domain-containing protein [Candidatus Dormibacteraeota bacterium]|nr:PIN domain-containing protein [Candidatus Dormibacteraeota bacterium]
MGQRLILDTSVVIAGARGDLDLGRVFGGEDDVVLPAITLAEYMTGVLLADSEARRAERRAFLEEVLAVTPVEVYTPAVAEHHAALLAHVRRTGTSHGAHDLIIAATARATGRLLLSSDERARFNDLPKVAARLVRA